MPERLETWTVLKVLTWTKGYLAEKGVGNARLEAEWLLVHALGLDRVGLYVNYDKPLTGPELAMIRGLVARRARREPLQHILGTQEFMGMEFEVSPSVLIPRHDTEVLVDEAVKRAVPKGRILDIGVGSGCIAAVLARLLPESEVFGVEKSPEAMELAQRNLERFTVKVTLFEGSLFEPFLGQTFEMIVSNPPYIPTGDLETLQPEVRDFEPRGALDGGPDGLEFYRAIIPAAPEFLAPGGWVIFEVGIGQSSEVLAIFGTTGRFGELFTAKDQGMIERVVGGRLL